MTKSSSKCHKKHIESEYQYISNIIVVFIIMTMYSLLYNQNTRRRGQLKVFTNNNCQGMVTILISILVSSLYLPISYSFQVQLHTTQTKIQKRPNINSDTSTSLHVWFFGGSSNEVSTTYSTGDTTRSSNSNSNNNDSCELVAVRIERTSPNSRRIGGEITIPRPIDDVWAILTDYDNLAIHVPNLVESRRVNPSYHRSGFVSADPMSQPGDGRYKCRLFQKGAQKIIGFEFGASVTMDMTEMIRTTMLPNNNNNNNSNGYTTNYSGYNYNNEYYTERIIGFKCVDSQFFFRV
jgi:carbon monoxide dehydrogenase subunit G